MAALNIRDPEVHELARQLAARTGESMTQAVRAALLERLQRTAVNSPDDVARRRRAILDFAAQVRHRLVDDSATEDDILGYNEYGTFD